jgi:hypothetical protein
MLVIESIGKCMDFRQRFIASRVRTIVTFNERGKQKVTDIPTLMEGAAPMIVSYRAVAK